MGRNVLLLGALLVWLAGCVLPSAGALPAAPGRPADLPTATSPAARRTVATPITSTPTAAASPTTADETSGWKVYTNARVGFQIKYPARYPGAFLLSGPATAPTLNADGSEDNDVITFGTSSDDYFYLQVFPFVGTLDMLIQAQDKKPGITNDIPTEEVKNLTVAGTPARWFLTTVPPAKDVFRQEVYWLARRYGFVLQTDPGHDQAEIAAMVSTFGLIQAGSSGAATATPAVAPTPTPDLAQMEIRQWASASPDGQWVAEALAAFPPSGGDYYTRLVVRKSDGTAEWKIVDRWQRLALGYTTPQPFHWSQDGRVLYFTNLPVPDGCAVFVNGSDLLRVELATGQVEQTVPPVGLWLSLSPDEKTLAYIGTGQRGLVLRDLATGDERQLQLNLQTTGAQMGGIVWSPDGGAVVLTVAPAPCERAWTARSIVRVDLSGGSQTTLLADEGRGFTTMAWPEPDRVELRDKDGQPWWLNARTGALGRADMPAPTPAQTPATAAGEGFAIYLTAETLSVAQMLATDLGQVEPTATPLISAVDIRAYRQAGHEIELTPEAHARIQGLAVPIAGLPFLVCVDRRPVYWGAFWTPLSSASFQGVAIQQLPGPGSSTIRIELGYPSAQLFNPPVLTRIASVFQFLLR